MAQDGGFGFSLRKPSPVVAATLGVLLVVWIVIALAVRFGGDGGLELYEALALRPAEALRGHALWTVLTAVLLHSLDDTGHLLMNGLVFYFFAPDLEERWGVAKFLLFMLVTALGGSAFVIAAYALHLSHVGSVVGFSGVVMGVTTAWGLTYPDREMWLFFFRLKGLHLVFVTIALQVLTALSFSNVSASAHFGGIFAGAVFAATQAGPIRRWWLERKLAGLQAQASGTKGRHVARRPGGPALRVIKGGADDDGPKDKRYLN